MLIPYSNDGSFVLAGQVYDDFYRCADFKPETTRGGWAPKGWPVARRALSTRASAYERDAQTSFVCWDPAVGPVGMALLDALLRAVLARPCATGKSGHVKTTATVKFAMYDR